MSVFDEILENREEDDDTRKVDGITTGIVKENWDEKHPGMVKVEIFMGETGKSMTDWVRVASIYAGKGYGAYMLPEVGDEVVISFNMGDTNRPYVLGSLWNTNQKIPEETANKDNSVKRIKTKGGHEIIFEEEKGKERLEIHTPANLKLTMEDKTEIIKIQDKDGNNMLTLDCKKGDITIKAKTSITFDAGGKASLKLDGNGNKATLKAGSIAIEGQTQLELKGQNMNVKGNKVAIKGDAALDVNTSGVLTLKGSLTKIN